MDNVKRILIVDDSPLICQILSDMLESAPGFQVIGQAADGMEALKLTEHLRPDVITMDIRMPRMNGLEATREIMLNQPTPIVVVANSIYESDLNIAFNAVAAGALTVVEKPRGLEPEDYDAVREQLLENVRLMSQLPLVTLGMREATPGQTSGSQRAQPEAPTRVIAISASMGGPGALNQILRQLPHDFSIPILIVQHLSSGFLKGFMHWLDSQTLLHIRAAEDGERLAAGIALVAPESRSMCVAADETIRLAPSVSRGEGQSVSDSLFESIAQTFGASAIGIVLSGAGEDGLSGLIALRRAGGYVIAQEELSSAVFETPRRAVELGIVDRVSSPEEIAEQLMRLQG